MITLANVVSVHLDTTILMPRASQCRTVLQYYSLPIHLDLLVECIFQDLEQYDQTHPDLEAEEIGFRTRKMLKNMVLSHGRIPRVPLPFLILASAT